MPEPTPEHIELLRDILATMRELAQVMREHAATSDARHAEVAPALRAYQREIEAREAAHAAALAEAQAEITRLQTLAQGRGKVAEAEADASAAQIRRWALKAIEILFLLAVGGGGVAGYLDHAQADTPAAEVSP